MYSATESLKKEWEKQNQKEDWLLLLTNLPQVISNLYQKYKSAEALDHGLYRHGICHGLQTDFGVDKNSLRLILIIDRIIFFMEDN
ncbi:hypothetical protein [Cylindrospermum sp. FACHB-282]|uniref:hypothetical protein n=1 Tax=Cylindrospermum sp. FACHB-282 TaxID=2692794 RepID=UPI001687CD29|nr:hypothetical protein [Cylindrospermum sp. FACHB-282]MBD2387066.1 hypothetical protein [Cylindrospermum sp. FACHB-282]